MTKAWMLRQDGEAFPVKVHLYAMEDEDLSSEAEVASFLIATNSDDQDLAEEVLFNWMTILIENDVDVDDTYISFKSKVKFRLNNLPYKFPYPLTFSKYMDIFEMHKQYNNIDEYYEYMDRLDSSLQELQTQIRLSLNQQFSRVRYGGTYGEEGNSTLWCRVSSVNYNWANTFYIFIAQNYKPLHVQSVCICRDPESDNVNTDGEIEYFYKAKDGRPYYMMPIDEYLTEEHEHSPVFSSRMELGPLHHIKASLASGKTVFSVWDEMARQDIMSSERFLYTINRMIKREQTRECVESSEYFDNAITRTKSKLQKIMRTIVRNHPEIASVDIDAEPYETLNNKRMGIKYIFEIQSDIEQLDHAQIEVAFSKPEPTADEVVRMFRREFKDYKDYLKL